MQSVFHGTAAGTGSGATATIAADGQKSYVATCISGHTDADSIINITDGSSTLWESKIDVSAEGFSFHFPGLNITTLNNSVIVGNVVSSSSDCQVTISGYSI